MISQTKGLNELLDQEVVAFLKAVKEDGQPQTSPIWYMREGDDIVVYNRPEARRLRSILTNPYVSFNLRADNGGHSGVTLEGTAAVEEGLPPAREFPGYEAKYAAEIAGLGWTPQSFSDDYPVGIRIKVTRVRSWGVNKLLKS